MINTQELEKVIEASGLRKSFIAEKLGITSNGFIKKRKGLIPFRVLEIAELQRLLNLSDEQVRSIFRADEVAL